jgi:hypothetical protein
VSVETHERQMTLSERARDAVVDAVWGAKSLPGS